MGSSSNGNPMVAIDVEGLSRSMRASLGTKGKRLANKDQCTIYRMPNAVWKEHEQHYCPKIIGMGLLHHDDNALKQMERLKWSYLQDLIDRNRQENFSINNYILAVNNIKEEARRYYAEPPELDDEALVKMMVLDGGFLLEFLIKAYWGENERFLDDVKWNLPLLRRDLLLLENQIPFRILQVLFHASNFPDRDGPRFTPMNLAVAYVTRNKPSTLPEDKKVPSLEVTHHLLHVYHASIRPTPRSTTSPAKFSCWRVMRRTLMWMEGVVCDPLLCLLSTFLNCDTQLGCCGIKVKPKSPIGIPTATKLKESGVKFKKKKNAISILDVSFDKEEGVMEIPKLSIQEATIPLYRNLIAFEQCCPKTGDHFTSYATLMNSLIDTAADVEILKDRGIIESKLGEDREVAEFFNNLCKDAYLNYDEHHFVRMFEDVVAYSNFVRHKWRAGLMHNYFGNPWATISLIAATVLLCLTLLQTFYAAYEYYHPNSS